MIIHSECIMDHILSICRIYPCSACKYSKFYVI